MRASRNAMRGLAAGGWGGESKAAMCVIMFLALLCTAAFLADWREFKYAGMAIAARMPMTITTMSSSMSVKPRCRAWMRFMGPPRSAVTTISRYFKPALPADAAHGSSVQSRRGRPGWAGSRCG